MLGAIAGQWAVFPEGVAEVVGGVFQGGELGGVAAEE
jgi:hypothetical protein